MLSAFRSACFYVKQSVLSALCVVWMFGSFDYVSMYGVPAAWMAVEMLACMASKQLLVDGGVAT